jgi:uncharacterized membrane protein
VLVNIFPYYYLLLTLQFIGVFGWLNVYMPGIFYLVAVLLLVSTPLVFRAGVGSSPIEAAWSLVLYALTFVLVATAMYLTYDTIGGIQGRYLLPTIGLLAVAASSGLSSRSMSPLVPQVATFSAACCLVLFSVFWIASRYALFA